LRERTALRQGPHGERLNFDVLPDSLGSTQELRSRSGHRNRSQRRVLFGVSESSKGAGNVRLGADGYENLQGRLQNRVRELRSRVQPRGAHARLRTTMAELQCGWEIWLDFALEAGAIDKAELIQFADRRALSELAVLQTPYQTASNLRCGFWDYCARRWPAAAPMSRTGWAEYLQKHRGGGGSERGVLHRVDCPRHL
jgi:hypothetical protein